jgi:hypothetical protein
VKYPEDDAGHPHEIRYDFAEAVDVSIRVTITRRYNYPLDGDAQIAAAIVAWAEGSNVDTGKPNIPIGGDSRGNLSWTDVLASFVNSVHGFDLVSMQFSTNGGSTWTANGDSLPLSFNQVASIASEDIEVVEA